MLIFIFLCKCKKHLSLLSLYMQFICDVICKLLLLFPWKSSSTLRKCCVYIFTSYELLKLRFVNRNKRAIWSLVFYWYLSKWPRFQRNLTSSMKHFLIKNDSEKLSYFFKKNLSYWQHQAPTLYYWNNSSVVLFAKKSMF